MDIRYAEGMLYYHTLENDGGYTLLRLGQDPGAETVKNLRTAIQLIGETYANEEFIPRKIVLAFCIIMHLRDECLKNLETEGAPKEVFEYVHLLEQDAFNAIAEH